MRFQFSLLSYLITGASFLFSVAPAGPAVADSEGCPGGAKRLGAAYPKGLEMSCVKVVSGEKPVKHGPYRKWYRDGKPQEFATFYEDRYDGKYQRWHKNGVLFQERSYAKGEPDGRWVSYYPNGNKHEELNYKEGVKEGPAVKWYRDGRIESRGNFQGGLKQGKFERYYKNGQIRERGKFVDDKQNGKWIRWSETGMKILEGTYVNGLKDGKWTQWYNNGEKRSEGEYRFGERTGKWSFWSSDGKLQSERMFVASRPHDEDQALRELEGDEGDWEETGKEKTKAVGVAWFDRWFSGDSDNGATDRDLKASVEERGESVTQDTMLRDEIRGLRREQKRKPLSGDERSVEK